MFKQRFREYFTYTKKERNGIIVLLFILCTLIVFRIYQNKQEQGAVALMTDEFQAEIEAFEESMVSKEIEKKESAKDYPQSKRVDRNKWNKPSELFYFDPNLVTEKELEKLGFSKQQISTWINYREKGGFFYKKEDILKIYGVQDEQYGHLKEYIQIKQAETVIEQKETEIEVILIEINSATKEELMILKGIGNSFAERIIKYRKKLGGFYAKKQLMEVYGLDSLRYKEFCNDINIDTLLLTKLDINKADYKALISHPYLNRYQTESILKYRELVGSFTDIEQIYQNKLLTKDDFLKIKPYLDL